MNIVGFAIYVALLMGLGYGSFYCFRQARPLSITSRFGNNESTIAREAAFGFIVGGWACGALFVLGLLYGVSLITRIHTPFEPGRYQGTDLAPNKPVPDRVTPPPGPNPNAAEQDEQENLRRAQREQEDSFKH